MLVGRRIKELRIKKGLSQQQLGELIGVTKVSVCGYESGTRVPSLDTFEQMAQIFETTTDFLLGREVMVKDANTLKVVSNMAEEDIKIILELKHYNSLYTKITKDIKRSINLINKKMN